MQNQPRLSGIPTPKEEEQDNFKLDSEASFACLTLTPIHTISDDGEGDFISYHETLEIKPYPNPFSFGGMWGSGGCKPGEETKIIDDFKSFVEPWFSRGLTKFEIKRMPPETRHILTEVQREAAIEIMKSPENRKKIVAGQKPLF